jgi:DNA-binding HxlR family transcriptional regulator
MFMPIVSRETALRLRETLTEGEQVQAEETAAELCHQLGKAQSMAVIRAFAFAEGSLRFSQLEEDLDVSPNTLSNRLREFTECGLLHRRSYSERPPRVEYSPTKKAEALFPALAYLDWWSAEYDLESSDAPE